MKINLNQNISKENLRGIYIEHKPLIVPVLSIVVSIFLILFFLLPQILAFPAKKTTIDAEEQKLVKIKNATAYARIVNNQLLDEDLKIVGQVLPVDKSFEGALNALSAAANSAQVTIVQYQFYNSDVGGSVKLKAIPSLGFSVSLQGEPGAILVFANELYKTAPLSEIREISYSDGTAKILVVFFYKPLAPNQFQDGSMVRQMNSSEQTTMNTIREWTLPLSSDATGIQALPSTGSASLSSSPL